MHPGLVVVGEMGAGDRQERLALGETPNLAARLQELAAPDTVVISDATRALVEGYFEHEPLGALTLRPYWLGALAEAQSAQRELDEALATIDSAIGHAREHGSLLFDAEIHRPRGALVLRLWLDEPARAADEFDHALSVARGQ